MSLLSILETIFIGPLKLLFEIIFQVADRFVDHPGLSIIVLSLVMNILVLPLYKRADAMQEESRDTEARLSRGVNHIKKVFSGDERMMILQTYYRQNNYKPTNALNGSVSLLLEIPFFMAAYQFLSHLDVLSGVSLGPIKDLSAPDGLIVIGSLSINLLPVLMTAVNVISSAIYLKGFPLKTKIQLYAMALFFLVFLYTSPSGLVFYWTLNNVFSLAKNIFYKIKNPAKVLRILTAVLGVASIGVGFAVFPANPLKRAFLIVLGLALMFPLLWNLLQSKITIKKTESTAQPNKKVFVCGCLFLTALMGLLIPSTFIAASPQEYVDISYFHHPLWYLVSTAAMAVGFFMVWFRVFYWLASPKGKVIFDRLMWVLCGITIVNYMFFGTNLGVISSNLVYDNEMAFTTLEYLLNTLAVLAVAVLLYLVATKWSKIIPPVLLVASIALTAMSGLHVYTTAESVSQISVEQSDTVPNFNLSKTGKNVIVMMIDRGMGSYLPYLMQERPELREQFAGFTCYTNVISHGACTNFGSPGLFGGYEYTPVEMNKRDGELLKDKHNEALKLMPVLFAQNGYDVTVCDPVYANYNWLADTSIYDEYPDIDTFVTEGAFSDNKGKIEKINNGHRNFFCFSAMKSMPLLLQPFVYDDGAYNQAVAQDEGEYTYVKQVIEAGSTTKAEGVSKDFVNPFNVLVNLPNITKTTDDEAGTFLMIANNAAHEDSLLQRPEYVPTPTVDNTEFDAKFGDNVTVDGKVMHLTTVEQKAHYQANMAVMLQLGKWMDYLREQGVYDNTKIIFVADHGFCAKQFDELIVDGHDVQIYHPLLLVKDFDSTEFTVSDEFMTNADVPTIAFADCVENPVNPFTGNPINNDEKTAHDQYITLSLEWDTKTNNGNTFTPSKWAKVSDDMWNKKNWEFYNEKVVLKDHEFPTE
ncbi:MAG: YidC/Oxa1 family membrane protein insertase [Clostridia bacterium]|nr:YidC/Oxa1 family membrane protein insertase [Clostridia bacterium]